MAIDIAEMLFREILGMSAYPGSPFTGNIFQDIILFFFVPTVFLVIFVYLVSGLIIPPTVHKLRLLMAIAIYAFIIASRYFEGFAIFASQFYFVFIIFIGILYFISTHFRRAGRGGSMAYEGRGGAMAHEGGNHGGGSGAGEHYDDMSRGELLEKVDRIKAEIRDLDREISQAQASKEQSRLEGLRMERVRLNSQLRQVDDQLKIINLKKFRVFR